MISTAFAVVCGSMAVLWGIQWIIGNAAVVDVGWTLAFVFTHLWLAAHAPGNPQRNTLLAAAVAVWGLRLGGHLFLQRVWGGAPEEGRYQKLRDEWGDKAQLYFFIFFQLQAVMAVALALPFWPAYANPGPLGLWEWLGLGLFALALPGVALADQQLDRFKKNPANHGKVCEVGLWGWSRHPNYFFESLIWFSWALFALGSPHGGLALISPSLILYFILRVTGIPPTEQQSLRSKGEAFRDYQRRVSVFIPMRPRH
jgi:steroid 5-alpha reductase family enzyme